MPVECLPSSPSLSDVVGDVELLQSKIVGDVELVKSKMAATHHQMNDIESRLQRQLQLQRQIMTEQTQVMTSQDQVRTFRRGGVMNRGVGKFLKLIGDE